MFSQSLDQEIKESIDFTMDSFDSAKICELVGLYEQVQK